MSNYRIIKYTNPFHENFKVQKQSFFGVWYNFNNFDGYTAGYYNTYAEALKAIDWHRSKTKTEIIDVQ
jgi:hypothetical protein